MKRSSGLMSVSNLLFFAATDLSQAGNSAVLYALSVVERGGEVTVVHVLEEAELDPAARAKIADDLSALWTGPRPAERNVQVHVALIESEARAAAICAGEAVSRGSCWDPSPRKCSCSAGDRYCS